MTTAKIVNGVILPSELTLTIDGTEVRYKLQSVAYLTVERKQKQRPVGITMPKSLTAVNAYGQTTPPRMSAPFKTCTAIMLRRPCYFTCSSRSSCEFSIRISPSSLLPKSHQGTAHDWPYTELTANVVARHAPLRNDPNFLEVSALALRGLTVRRLTRYRRKMA